MHNASAFCFVCAGLLLVAVIHEFGAQIAGAQARGNPVVAVSDPCVYTANGDCCQLTLSAGEWAYRGNVFGSSTSAQGMSIGQLKAKYATPQGKAGQVTEDR